MGGADEHYPPRKRSNHRTRTQYKLKILLLVIFTNLLTISIFAGSFHWHPLSRNTLKLSLPLSDYTKLWHELNSTRNELERSRFQISDLHKKLQSSNLLAKSLLSGLSRLNQTIDQHSFESLRVSFSYNDFVSHLSNEAKLAIGLHKLPLGFSPRMGSDEVYPSVGGSCLMYKEELAQYMSYNVGGECPLDDVFAQKLMLKGCEPLPRRRCHPKSPSGYVEPTPLPDSLWSIPPDTSIIWDPYTCKSYGCLVERRKLPEFYDCKDCFDLQGREKTRWLFNNGGLDYEIDQALGTKPPKIPLNGVVLGGINDSGAAEWRIPDVVRSHFHNATLLNKVAFNKVALWKCDHIRPCSVRRLR